MKRSSVAALVAGLILPAGSAVAQDKPPCAVGVPVRVLACINYPGRLVAHDPKTGRYQVQCDRSGDKSWVSANDLRLNCVAQAPPAAGHAWLLGRWSVFSGPTPQYETRGGDRYLVVGAGARAGFLELRPDGTYTWPGPGRTYSGKWRVMNPGELKYGTKAPAVLLINGPSNMDWQMWKRDESDAENRDKVKIEGMKIGLSYEGTRVR